jgi:hypothetical protein
VTTVHEGNHPDFRVVKLHTGKCRESAATKAFIQCVPSERGDCDGDRVYAVNCLCSIGYSEHAANL